MPGVGPGRPPPSPYRAFARLPASLCLYGGKTSETVYGLPPPGTCAGLGILVGWDMLIEGEPIKRRGFWPLALLWPPAGMAVTTGIRFRPEAAVELPAPLIPAAGWLRSRAAVVKPSLPGRV